MKQLLWEMKRERKCQRSLVAKAGDGEGGACDGGESDGDGDGDGDVGGAGAGDGEGEGGGGEADLALCSKCGVPASGTPHAPSAVGTTTHGAVRKRTGIT